MNKNKRGQKKNERIEECRSRVSRQEPVSFVCINSRTKTKTNEMKPERNVKNANWQVNMKII